MRFRATRWACNLPVRVQCAAGHYKAEMANISTTGAWLRALVPVRPGERLSLRIRETELATVVARTDGRGVGVQFLRELSQAEVFAIRKAVAGPRRAIGPQRGAWEVHGFHELE